MRRSLFILLLIAVAACSGRQAVEVPLARLVAQQDAYNGRTVVAVGTLRSHPDPAHYWIEDDRYNRVEVAYGDNLAPYLGQRLAVRGLFRYSPDEGRRIDVEYLAPSPSAGGRQRETSP
ncbi:MAG TPA: hypothetical protein VJ947_08600 [Pseudohaliea sp.]|nr:hypothetical protein [Pseudohaliea sp.]